jgi:predicted transcriptional regulator
MIIYEEMEKMKQKDIYMFDDDDDRAIQLFVKLGMPKNLAKTLLYISQFNECQCAEIEQGADLRQPEVSIAMQELQKRNWVKKRNQKKKGKGRPVHIYKPAIELTKILKTFEQEKMQEFENIKKDISELKTIINER